MAKKKRINPYKLLWKYEKKKILSYAFLFWGFCYLVDVISSIPIFYNPLISKYIYELNVGMVVMQGKYGLLGMLGYAFSSRYIVGSAIFLAVCFMLVSFMYFAKYDKYNEKICFYLSMLVFFISKGIIHLWASQNNLVWYAAVSKLFGGG